MIIYTELNIIVYLEVEIHNRIYNVFLRSFILIKLWNLVPNKIKMLSLTYRQFKLYPHLRKSMLPIILKVWRNKHMTKIR